ncbi:MAG: acyl carrier protein [Bryobacteraceae bacterium]
MDRNELLRSLDELMDLEPGTLTGDEVLAELGGWSSLAVIGFIAMADEHGVAVSPGSIAKCKTVDELVRLAGAETTGQPA